MKCTNNDRTGIPLRAAFTLIELLVVIAIISLLVSILIPSLTKAKALAQRTACQANQRTIGMAFEFYAEDNHEVYISCPRSAYNPAENDSCWPSYLTPYLEMPPRDYHSDPAQPWGMSWLYSPEPTVFRCPTATKAELSYSLNFDVGWTVQNGLAWGYRISEGAAHASQTMRMGEPGRYFYIYSAILYDSSLLATRHSNGGNYLFCDSHVEWVPAEMGIWTWTNSDHSIRIFW